MRKDVKTARGSRGIFGAMLAALTMLSPALADDVGYRTEALMALVIGIRNWIILGFDVTKGVVADDRKSWRAEPLDIVGTVLVLNQLDVPCVPVAE